MSEVVANKWSNPDGTENYKCRAWVNFDASGTPFIRGNGNISSITDEGTGRFVVNFDTALPDANYSVSIIAQGGGNGVTTMINTQSNDPSPLTVNGFPLRLVTTSGTLLDSSTVCANVFR
jgi:hypothetical protein